MNSQNNLSQFQIECEKLYLCKKKNIEKSGRKMIKLKKSLYILILLLIQCSLVFGVGFPCSYDKKQNGRCFLKDLELTTRDNCIEPKVGIARIEDVESINLSGKVPVLRKDCKMCEILPYLKVFLAPSISLEELEENAFEGCTNLTQIDLEKNMITKLHRNAFKGLPNLETLKLTGGNISNFDLDLTDSKKLKVLKLNQMNISSFNADILLGMSELTEFDISSNNLFELDVVKILNNAPNLKIFDITGNNFECNRLSRILYILSSRNIKTYWIEKMQNLKQETSNPKKVFDLDCFLEENWKIEFKRQMIAKTKVTPVEKLITYALEEKDDESSIILIGLEKPGFEGETTSSQLKEFLEMIFNHIKDNPSQMSTVVAFFQKICSFLYNFWLEITVVLVYICIRILRMYRIKIAPFFFN